MSRGFDKFKEENHYIIQEIEKCCAYCVYSTKNFGNTADYLVCNHPESYSENINYTNEDGICDKFEY